MGSQTAIDAVVTWVDGSDPHHAAKVAYWLERSRSGPRIVAKAAIPHRFVEHDEIIYCLRSIRNHAPWLRTIWLVTDNQVPKGLDRRLAELDGVRVVDHRHIFRGLEELLPTFNSIAIETLTWRIEGLAERYIAFNDDMFIAKPVTPEDFFKGDRTILRGRYLNWSVKKPAGHHGPAQFKAAKMAGADLARIFVAAHCPHPMLKSVMKTLYEKHFVGFVHNAALRFRTMTRFYPPTLHDLYLIANDRAILRSTRRSLYMSIRQCEQGSPEYLRNRFDEIASPHILTFCINVFAAVLEKLPDANDRLAALTGPPLPFEIASCRNP